MCVSTEVQGPHSDTFHSSPSLENHLTHTWKVASPVLPSSPPLWHGPPRPGSCRGLPGQAAWGGLLRAEAAPPAAFLPSAHPRGHLASLEDRAEDLRGGFWGWGGVAQGFVLGGGGSCIGAEGRTGPSSIPRPFLWGWDDPRVFTPCFINASLSSSRFQSPPRNQLLLASLPRLQIPNAQQNSPLIEAAVPGAHQSPSKGRLARIAHQPRHFHHSRALARPRGAPPKTQN